MNIQCPVCQNECVWCSASVTASFTLLSFPLTKTTFKKRISTREPMFLRGIWCFCVKPMLILMIGLGGQTDGRIHREVDPVLVSSNPQQMIHHWEIWKEDLALVIQTPLLPSNATFIFPSTARINREKDQRLSIRPSSLQSNQTARPGPFLSSVSEMWGSNRHAARWTGGTDTNKMEHSRKPTKMKANSG